MTAFFNFVAKHLGLMAVAGILIGLAGGDFFWFLEHYPVFGLFGLLFLAALKTPVDDLWKKFQKPFWAIYMSFLKLIALPLVVFLIAGKIFPPEYLPGMVLLAGIPAAVATPAIATVLKGDVKLGFLVVIITNFLVPLTLPFILAVTASKVIDFDIDAMFVFLVFIIFTPFIVGSLLKVFHKKTANVLAKHSKGISVLLVFVFNIAVISPHRDFIFDNLNFSLTLLGLAFGLALFMNIFGLIVAFKCKKQVIVTSIILMAYTNTGLAILLAHQYLDPTTILLAVLYEIPWSVGFIPLQRIFAR